MPYLAHRDALSEAKDTLSSWDKCMAKTYCKSVSLANISNMSNAVPSHIEPHS